ncbi:hypothetical protein SAMN04488508_1151, partial [Aquimarina spongiae]
MKNIQTYTYYLFFALLFIGKVIYAQLGPVPILDDQCVDAQPGSQWYWYDNDRDGWGGPNGSCRTSPGTGYVLRGGDCNDNNPNIKGPSIWYYDDDNDGFGAATGPTIRSCSKPANYVDNNKDCNDNNPNIKDPSRWYADIDEDGAGNPSDWVLSCTQPAGRVANTSDCDDNDPDIQQITWYRDEDGDGFGENTYTLIRCTRPGDNFYPQNTDLCPGVNGPTNGCPASGSDTAEHWNTVKVTSYDITENEIA